jgi:zinc and cadmium transporter
MREVVFYALLSVILISLVSLAGLVTFKVKRQKLQKALIYLVSFSAGAMMGDVFIHLVPEIAQDGFLVLEGIYVLSGIVTFFIIEKFIHWHHCHSHEGQEPFTWVNLMGDSVHNFIDGIVIAASYLVSLPVGFATTIAVFFHELPQEIGDFAVLLHGGFSRGKALFFNFLTALTAVLGAILALALSDVGGMLTFFVPFAAGTLLYIAGADLIPELHKEVNVWKSLGQMICLLAGAGVMFALLLLE